MFTRTNIVYILIIFLKNTKIKVFRYSKPIFFFVI